MQKHTATAGFGRCVMRDDVTYKRVRGYVDAGISVLPTAPATKQPSWALLPRDDQGHPEWRRFQKRIAEDSELQNWFLHTGAAPAIVCGEISGHLEILDFENARIKNPASNRGLLYDLWAALVREQAPELVERLPLVATQHQGRHAYYRCKAGIGGSSKLAEYLIEDPATGRPSAKPGSR